VDENSVSVEIVPLQEWIDSASVAFLATGAILLVLIAARLLSSLVTPDGRSVMVAEYAPPRGVNVMVAAHLLGRSRTAIPAQLLELAIAKNIRVLDRSLRRGRSAYAVQFLSHTGAGDFERQLLDALFGSDPRPGLVRELRAQDRALRRSISDVSAAAFTEARVRGWRSAPGTLQWLLVAAAALLFGGVTTAAFIFVFFWLFSWLFVAAFLVSVAVLAISIASIRLFGPLTEEGVLVRDHLRGIRIYLRLAEKDRLRMLQGAFTADRSAEAGAAIAISVYERLLPYAVVWNVERTWITELIGNATDLDKPPAWVSDVNVLSFFGTFRRLTSVWKTRQRLYLIEQVRLGRLPAESLQPGQAWWRPQRPPA